jgi:hypothetical protein
VLRRIVVPKRDKVTGECTKLHNKELHDLHSSPTTVRVIEKKMDRARSMYGGGDRCVQDFGGET